MAGGRTPAERRASRAPVFAVALAARHGHGRGFAVTPRAPVTIVPTSVTPPHEIERAMVKRDPSVAPKADATFTPAPEATTDVSKT